MPETNYGAIKATVPKTGDYAPGGADVPRAFREFTDSIGTGQGAGKLVIAQNTGAAAFKAMKGDATLAEDGTLTVADGAISSRKLKPTTGIKRAEADFTLSEAWQDVAMVGGQLKLTPAVPSNLLVWASFNMGIHNGSRSKGRIMVDAEAREEVSQLMNGEATVGAEVNMALFDLIPLTAAEHTIKLQVTQLPGSTLQCKKLGTRMMYMLVAS